MTNTVPSSDSVEDDLVADDLHDDLDDASPRSHPSVLPRPSARRAIVARAAELVGFYGVGRLAMWLVAVAIVLGVGWWLMRPPQTPTESLLPAVTTVPATPIVGSSSPSASPSPSPSPSLASSVAGPDVLVVHVAGAVATAGVYELAPGGRVHDAIEAAGGSAANADLDRVNLAAPLSDGARVHVPAVGEPDPPPIDPSMVVTADEATDAGGGTSIAPVDVNRAGAVELERLPGVGPSIAAAIVDEREQGGPFASLDDLQRVSGIGPARLEAIRDLVVL